MLQRLLGPGDGADGQPQALVIVPTRELCVQVTGDLRDAGATRKVRALSIYGGRAYEPQVEALKKGIDIVVGTPGRLIDLSRQGHLSLSSVKVLVLDEADEMLDLGFLPDIERIVAQVPAERQTMLFSATMPGPIVTLARRFMRQPVHIRAESAEENRVVPTTRQVVYRAHAMDKVELLARILQARGRGLTMIFARTKRTAQKVADELELRGFAAAAVHGDLGQGAREQALRAFRAGKVDVLVATDVAARGIDVPDVTHVINYQVPDDEKTYLHRIGRTGRAGADGVAVTFVDWDEQHKWKLINEALSLEIPAAVETYSTSPHLHTDLDVPTGITGRLPRGQRTRAGLDAEVVEDLGETGRRGGPAKIARGSTTAGREAGGRDGGRVSSAAAGGELGEVQPRQAASARSRSRSRTRGAGAALAAVDVTVPVGGGAPGPSGSASSTSAAAGSTAPGPVDGGPVGETDGDAPAKRRRRRGGRGRGRGASADATAAGQ